MQTCGRWWALNREESGRCSSYRMMWENKHSPTVICAAITSKMNKAKLPTHVELSARQCDMVRDSVILLEQLRTIDKQRLREKICHIDENLQEKVNEALRISLELAT